MGVKEKKLFLDLRLRLELMLDGYSTDFRTKKIFQETDRVEVVCHHLGYPDTTPGGFMRGAQKWGNVLSHAYLHANSVLRQANGFGKSKIDVKPHSLPIPSLICHLFPKFKE